MGDDVREVWRFIVAAQLSFAAIHERSLTQSLIKELHARLMREDPRCPPEETGTYREKQNFIGPDTGSYPFRRSRSLTLMSA